jgi:hypothetical protein
MHSQDIKQLVLSKVHIALFRGFSLLNLMLRKMEFINPFKAFIEMLLNSEWVLRLAQYMQQIVIRQEKEPRES